MNTKDKIRINISTDADGHQVEVNNLTSNKSRTWRYDFIKGKDHLLTRYDLMRKPTTRTHEVVDVGNDFDSWINNEVDHLAQGVM